MDSIKKILVTGASGFLGSKIVDVLRANNFSVIGVGRKSASLAAEDMELDLREEKIIFPIDVGTVVHAAALLPSHHDAKKRDFYNINVVGTEKIMKAAAAAGVRHFIFASSAHVHGPNFERCVGESDDYNKNPSWYEWSKIEAEKKVTEFCRKNNLIYTIIRLGQLYGPRMLYGWPKVFEAIKNNHFFIFGDGHGVIQPLYIDDAVEIILRCIQNPLVENETFLAAGSAPIRLGDLFDKVAVLLGAKKIKRIPYFLGYLAALILQSIPAYFKTGKIKFVNAHNISMFRENRCYNIDKMAGFLNFFPVVDLETGLKNTIEWYGRKK